MKLDLETLSFDQWREHYDELSFDEQKAFARILAERYPEQRHFDEEAFVDILGKLAFRLGRPLRVLEVGGWRGELAAECRRRLGEHVAKWWNFDLVALPSENDPAWFTTYELDGPIYSGRITRSFDVLVAAHVFEHMKAREVVATFEAHRPAVAVVEMPIYESAANWLYYEGTHVIEEGWRGITDRLFDAGWFCSLIVRDVRVFERK